MYTIIENNVSYKCKLTSKETLKGITFIRMVTKKELKITINKTLFP